MNKKSIYLLLLLLCLSVNIYSKVQFFPFNISFTTHTYSFPFYKMMSKPIQPGFSIGTELNYFHKNHSFIFQTANMGYYNNRFFQKALYFDTDLGTRYLSNLGIFADLMVNIGYMHSFLIRETFVLNENGEYESEKDRGKPSFIFGFKIGLGYKLTKIKHPIGIFIRYHWFGEVPFIKESIPVMAHSIVQFGISFDIKRNMERKN